MESSMTYRLEFVPDETLKQRTYALYYEGTEIAKCYLPIGESFVPGFRELTLSTHYTGMCYIEASDTFSETDALVLIAKLEDMLENPKFEIFSYNKNNKVMLLKSVLESCNYTRKKALYVLHD